MKRFLIVAGVASALAIILIILKGPKQAAQHEVLSQSAVTPSSRKLIASTPEDSKPKPTETFTYEGHQLPESLDVFIASHGKPLTENIIDPVETAEAPDKEWAKAKYAGLWRTVTYSGMEATYYQFKDGDGGHWTSVVISTPSIPVLWDLGVGSSTTNIVGRLGKPTSEHTTALEYSSTDDDTGQEYGKVEFKHLDGKVTEVVWSKFLD